MPKSTGWPKNWAPPARKPVKVFKKRRQTDESLISQRVRCLQTVHKFKFYSKDYLADKVAEAFERGDIKKSGFGSTSDDRWYAFVISLFALNEIDNEEDGAGAAPRMSGMQRAKRLADAPEYTGIKAACKSNRAKSNDYFKISTKPTVLYEWLKRLTTAGNPVEGEHYKIVTL